MSSDAVERPVRTELINEVQPIEQPEGTSAADQASGQERAGIQTVGLQQFYNLRVMWSEYIIGWISVPIIFQIVLITAVGLGALAFPKYETFFKIGLGTNFPKIIALATIVVEFLHSDKIVKDHDAPPI